MDTLYFSNPRLGEPTGALPSASDGEVASFHRSLPGYAPTSLRRMPLLARELGVGQVYAKNESVRLGLPSYKILGASYASYRAIKSWLRIPHDEQLGIGDLRLALEGSDLNLVAATDGNHGRAVAHFAAMVGIGAQILVPAGTLQARISAIESEGATVQVIDGTYDEAIAASATMADDSHLVVSDTAWPGYEATPQHVIDGYSTLFSEIDNSLAEQGWASVTHVAIQIGVGALAAAAVTRYRSGPDPATIVGVEPIDADCMLQSVKAGRAVLAPGPHRSTMVGLNCGLPSPLALPLAIVGISAFLAVADTYADEAIARLAREGIVAGESGAAGLAGLLALSSIDDPAQARADLRLGADSRVLIVVTEGDTASAK